MCSSDLFIANKVAANRWTAEDNADRIGANEVRAVRRTADLGPVGLEDILDSLSEDSGNSERQWQAGIVASCLDGVHRLPRNIELVGQVSLTPFAFRPEDAQPVFHG